MATVLGMMFMIVSGCIMSVHDIHISNTLLHYRSDRSSIELTLKIFADDMETALKDNFGVETRLFSDNESPVADSLIVAYLSSHFEIRTEQILTYTYIGKELSDDLSSVWLYLEIEEVTSPLKLLVKNTLLFDIFDDQQNMMLVKVDHKRNAHFIFDDNDRQTELRI